MERPVVRLFFGSACAASGAFIILLHAALIGTFGAM
jgi:hypothetical protein